MDPGEPARYGESVTVLKQKGQRRRTLGRIGNRECRGEIPAVAAAVGGEPAAGER